MLNDWASVIQHCFMAVYIILLYNFSQDLSRQPLCCSLTAQFFLAMALFTNPRRLFIIFSLRSKMLIM